VLSSSLLDIPKRDMLHILHHARDKSIPILQAVENFNDISELSSETREKLLLLTNTLSKLEEVEVDRDIRDFIFELLNITGYMAMLLTDPISEQAVKNVGAFCRFIAEYADRAINRGLHGFMKYLERYREAGGNPDQAGLEADADAVRLMTIHGAKGLEFPYVFVVGLTSRRFPTGRRKDAIPFPDALNRDILPGEDFHIQEERRLCYVAMTRAIEKLYLCAVEKKGAKPSQFIREISGNGEGDYVIEWVAISKSLIA
jgi:DNA helicase-2/ATP-dependent DNA helicase PcrA